MRSTVKTAPSQIPVALTPDWGEFEEKYAAANRLLAENPRRPVNLIEEERLFFKARIQGRTYEPSFLYSPMDASAVSAYEELARLAEDLPYPVADWYAKDIEETLEGIRRFSRRDYDGFAEWQSSEFGTPSPELLEYAEEILRVNPAETGTVSPGCLGAGETADFFRRTLADMGIDGWQVVLDSIPARVMINKVKLAVVVNERAVFEERELARLAVHEIGVHVVRYLNGSRFPFAILRTGLPGYLETEEGLSALAEERNGYLLPSVLRRYALRVIACAACMTRGFRDLFEYLRGWCESDREAFDITVRVKRGFMDTAIPGGFTKDVVYLRGLLGLRGQNDEVIRSLFNGKIGLRHIVFLVRVTEPATCGFHPG